jgi:hypothetical protein
MENEGGYVGGKVGRAPAVREVENQCWLLLVAESVKLGCLEVMTVVMSPTT